MGRVYLAHDPVLDRDVAVKLLRDDLNIPPEHKSGLLERMRQEARASARVSHPNIVCLHDMGEDPDLGLFLVFEYVEGKTLKDQLERGPIGPLQAARIAREVGDALTTAHSAGVLHRDIKPENVILARTGAKIADFGIARVPDSTLTRDGGLLGTPAYSAPESIADGEFSPLSDQFSMATTLYEAIGGRRAFPGDDAVAVASRISTDEPPAIAEVCGLDTHVDTVFARALSKNPRARFSTCEEFGHALAEALEVSPRTAMPTVPDEYHREDETRSESSRRTRIAIGGAAVGALVAVGGFQLSQQLRGGPPPTRIPPVASSPAEVAPPTPEENPVAWLEERPPQRKRSRRSASGTETHDAGSGDAGQRGARDAAVDAGGPSTGADAGAATRRP